MVLTTASIAHYLLERGLVSASSLVDGDFCVDDLSRRNRVLQVLRGPHPGYIVKQVKDWKPKSVELLESEARFYSLLRTESELASLRRWLPQCYAYDADNQALVLEFVAQLRPTRFSVEFAKSLGESLRLWHRDAAAAADLFQDFNGPLPWILSFHRSSGDAPLGDANAELKRVIQREAQRNGALGAALDALCDQWQEQTLIHGDMKWGNCLIAANDAAPRFIDWELAAWGDPLWDAAGILQEYLVAWVLGRAAEEVPPPMRAFWAAYGEPFGSLDKALGYAAVRMIQSAYERQEKEEQMTAPAVRVLQAAFNILTARTETIAAFFAEAV
jgi:hypothetical protein